MTKKTKLFLASSAELEADRRQFEIFLNRKNKEWVEKGAFLELVIWEDFLDVLADLRAHGFDFRPEWFAAQLEFRFPYCGEVEYGGVKLELRQALAQAEADGSTRAVVLRGAGGHFCAGGDFGAMASGQVISTLPIKGDYADLLLAMARYPRPIVARVEGVEDIKATLVKYHQGAAVTIGQVADVTLGASPKRGTATDRGMPAVVVSVQKSPEANTLALTERVDRVLDQVEASMPKGMTPLASCAWRRRRSLVCRASSALRWAVRSAR